MFPSRLQSVRAYGEAVNEYITRRSHQRRMEEAHVAELQRREQQNRDFIEYSYMENQDNGDLSNASHIAANEDTISDGRNHNESTPDTGTPRMSVFERAIYYAMYIMHFGIAEEEVSRMEELMTVIYGFRPPVTYETHVKRLNKSIINDYDHQRYFFCSACMELMSPTQYICTNRSCKIFGLPIKRAKRMERSEVHIVNILPQVTDILVDNFHEIIEMHQVLHERIDVSDRSDRRLFDGYYANIETASEFNRRHLRILLSLSIDGFVPRRISKKEVWPLYLRVEGLPPSKADQYFNSVIAGMMHTRLKPTQKMIEEFVRSNVVICAKTTYGNLNRLNDPDNHQLWNIANRISAEIARTIATKTARCMEFAERNAPNANLTVSLHNCAKLWNIRANPPFKQLNLMQLTKHWQGRKGNTYQQLGSLYRFVLQRITEPPQKIQEFSVRMSKNGGRNDDLLNLPDEIEEVLKDFGEDMIGLGHDELKPWIDVDLENSKFYKNLGETEDERSKHLEELREQQKDWRPHLFKCLQMALKDVRSYGFESGKWIPSDVRILQQTYFNNLMYFSTRASARCLMNMCQKSEEKK